MVEYDECLASGLQGTMIWVGLTKNYVGQKQHHGVVHEWTVDQARAWKLSNISEYTRLSRGMSNYKNVVPYYQKY